RRDRCGEEDRLVVGAIAVAAAAERAPVGAGIADLDVVAFLDPRRQLEGSGHEVDGIAGWSPKAERGQALTRLQVAPNQAHRKGKAHVCRIEQRAVAAIVDVELVAAAS